MDDLAGVWIWESSVGWWLNSGKLIHMVNLFREIRLLPTAKTEDVYIYIYIYIFLIHIHRLHRKVIDLCGRDLTEDSNKWTWQKKGFGMKIPFKMTWIQDHMVHNWLEKFDIIFHLYCVPICPCFKAFLQRGDGVDGVMGVLTGLKAGVSKSDVCCITPTVDGSEILQQMKLVVYPIIHGVLYMPGDCLGFLTYQQYVSWLFSKTCQRIMSTPCLVRMTVLLK